MKATAMNTDHLIPFRVTSNGYRGGTVFEFYKDGEWSLLPVTSIKWEIGKQTDDGGGMVAQATVTMRCQADVKADAELEEDAA